MTTICGAFELPPSLEALDLYGVTLLPALPRTLALLKLGDLAPPDLTAFDRLRELWTHAPGDWLDRLPRGLEILLGPKLTPADLWRFPRCGRSISLASRSARRRSSRSCRRRCRRSTCREPACAACRRASPPSICASSSCTKMDQWRCRPFRAWRGCLRAATFFLRLPRRSWRSARCESSGSRTTSFCESPTGSTLVELRRLNLRKNRLRDLPDRFARLAKLEELELVANQLEKIPSVLDRMPSLRHVQVHGNPHGRSYWP
jgi:hypothetical protein